MRVAVIGANGQLGQDLSKVLEQRHHEVHRLTHADIEICDLDAVRTVFTSIDPDCVVNTAAMLQVDKAEDLPELAFAVNAQGAHNLAELAQELDFTLVHFSTDYVFDGEKTAPYIETDPAAPLSMYAASKLAGEAFVRTVAPRHFVIRVSGIYGTAPCRAKQGENFVLTMLRLARDRDIIRVVEDEVMTPTFTFDIAQQLADLLQTSSYGLYHMTASGSCSWYEFAARIFSNLGVVTKLLPTTRNQFPTRAKRPRYSVLDNAALRAIRIEHMPHWTDGLARYLQQIKK